MLHIFKKAEGNHFSAGTESVVEPEPCMQLPLSAHASVSIRRFDKVPSRQEQSGVTAQGHFAARRYLLVYKRKTKL